MTAPTDPAVLETNPTTRASGAYPLAALSYAAATPGSLDQAARNDYASYITYGVTDGQTPGVHFGQLPLGYAPLPNELRTQALSAAAAIRNGTAATTSSSTPNNTPANNSPATNSGGAGGSGGAGTSGGPHSGTGGAGLGGNALAPTGSPPAYGPSGSNQPPNVAIRRASSRSRTPFDKAGGTRYVLLIALLVGLAAVVGSRLLRLQRRNPGDLDEAQPDPGLPVPYDST